jgi:iron complex transport system substrate-binding protein
VTGLTIRAFRPLVAALSAAWLLGMATGAAIAQDIKVQHARGETTLRAKPAKVLAFDLAALDILDALGVEVAGVPNAQFPPQFAKYGAGSYEKIGTLFEPNYEAVNAAEPDLIIVGGRSSAKYTELGKIAPTIDLATDPKDYVASVARNTRTLAQIFGKEARADALLAKLDASMAELRQTTAGAGKGLLVLTTGGKMSAYGPGSRFGVLHTGFGVVPAVENLATTNHGQAISPEFILETDPDWLFVIDRDAVVGRAGGAAKRVLENDLVAQTKAWKKGQVVYLDPVNWYLVGGGVSSLQASVDQLAAAFRKR